MMQEAASSDSGHVHFPEEEVSHHEAQILVLDTGKNHIDVKLGFLQLDHVYEVTFAFNHNLGEDLIIEPKAKRNAYVKVLSFTPTKDGKGHDVVLKFNARKEHVVNEIFHVSTKTKPKKKLTLQLCARILGPGKGTPILKEGIHILQVQDEYDLDPSDSHGYSE
ncbi:UPF0687 protein C20orf27 homolog [Octopus bimaculoides]|uniref:Adipose-secreted signaling protein n=1 Tax=Octopus bimaculoides TaxID=37653 RepID=A0A0L8HZB2_OCTBM|nr:UPF0687 protein C20orf27 homolog [Octopus bimaculoides]XP_014768105.1 UPF0687 protein C20orf27 homolog [Octopus bimaculoides]XP_052828656.1 UPF0687 protein C20orf27 homolog [Octopus bimaculoides]XP_052828657.1 UPF0687 protein C20orf27 homolog [Octopus bimaculoides]XP_052828658.1 UPF0687 protein C20orf27 homolog [Octopus bimaculoides]|eukprot:XP_014768104.1 PREDICTED: UPF0687 protein C20orf27 homolog [Octopus bimaculoides]